MDVEGGEQGLGEETAAQLAPPPERKSPDERKAELARFVANSVARGWRVESQTDYRAVFSRKELLAFERKQIAEIDEWGYVHVEQTGLQFSL